MRGVSTVFDVTLFLLFVTAAVGTLVAPPAAQPAEPAAPAEASLATTASVHYSLAPGARHGPASRFPTTESPEFRRTAHGSLATLLARGATRNLSIAGERVTHSHDEFTREVANATATRTLPRTRVRAVWSPYPGSSVRGSLTAGPRPPADARVTSRTLTVASGYPPVRERARLAAEREGYAGVAHVLARAVVRGTFPDPQTSHALHGDYPVDALVRHRYHRFGALLGTGVETPIHPERTNAALQRALADRFERDLRGRFDSPEEAAATVRVGEVHVTVRRWSR
ncbi:DUF7284 family protein [Natronomonas sp. EA1]|uniref:DUF7284 family protein n=1 Tax=Natronomonas sp. EA1 TaxID=3421655 RepID=UPI003EBA4DD4